MLHDSDVMVGEAPSGFKRHSKQLKRALCDLKARPPCPPAMIPKLMLAGADAFRINMSHGDQKTKAKLVDHIRALEKEFHRPTTILFDLQGPKLRVGQFQGGRTVLEKGTRFILDHDEKAGDNKRVQLPHVELFDSIKPGTNIL